MWSTIARQHAAGWKTPLDFRLCLCSLILFVHIRQSLSLGMNSSAAESYRGVHIGTTHSILSLHLLPSLRSFLVFTSLWPPRLPGTLPSRLCMALAWALPGLCSGLSFSVRRLQMPSVTSEHPARPTRCHYLGSSPCKSTLTQPSDTCGSLLGSPTLFRKVSVLSVALAMPPTCDSA